MRIQAIIFDFDGLILDTESTELAGWQEIYRHHRCELTLPMWADAVGRPNSHFDPCEALEKLLGQSVNRPQLWETKRALCRDLNLKLQAREGVLDYLRDAQRLGLKIGLASSSQRPWVTEHLARLGLLHYFHTLTTFEDTPQHKPHPAPYLAALQSLHASPNQTIALEDSSHGITAAKAANLFCLAIPNPVTKQMNLTHADLVLDSLLTLPLGQLLQRLNAPPEFTR